ncbi:hypothetical protein HYQ46_007807 [Verticillium longisporum]|nr:hypothetical protein HYQ46_007807 [Verticillium longisporum]
MRLLTTSSVKTSLPSEAHGWLSLHPIVVPSGRLRSDISSSRAVTREQEQEQEQELEHEHELEQEQEQE